MANTKITHLGNRRVAITGTGDMRKVALGNGTAKPGDLVGIDPSTGKVIGSRVGASELFVGIIDDDPTIAEDTAITDGKPLSVLLPKSGHLYRVKIKDPTGTKNRGNPVGFSDVVGAVGALAQLSTAGAIGYLEDAIGNGDTVALVRWK